MQTVLDPPVIAQRGAIGFGAGLLAAYEVTNLIAFYVLAVALTVAHANHPQLRPRGRTGHSRGIDNNRVIAPFVPAVAMVLGVRGGVLQASETIVQGFLKTGLDVCQ